MRALRPSPSPRTLRRALVRYRYWLITLPLAVLLVVTQVQTNSGAEVSGPTLLVQTSAVPGGQVVVTGDGFEPNAHIEIRWDGTTSGMPAARADLSGRFEQVVTVPPDAVPGTYLLTATGHAPDTDAEGQAALTVTVVTAADEGEPDIGGMPPHVGDGPKIIAAAQGTPEPSATPEFSVHPVARSPMAGHEGDSAPSTDGPAMGHANPGTATPGAAPSHDAGHAPAPPPSPTSAPHVGHPISGNPVTCDGYPEPRVFLEVHTWWEGAPLAAGQIAHLHAGSCFPLGQTVSGQVAFDVRITMHDNPGLLYRYETGLHTDGRGEGDLPIVDLNERCPTTCEYWVRTVVDTSRANDGFHELRFKPRVVFGNGEVQLTSSGWPLRTENGNPDGGFRDEGGGSWLDIVGRGWYDGHGYQNPVLRTVDGVLPGQVVQGVWAPTLRLDAGSDGEPATFAAAYVDPEFHFNDEDSTGGGVVLGTWGGPFRDQLAIDTTGLANGHHVLVLRVDAAHNGTRLVGLQYVPFIVAN